MTPCHDLPRPSDSRKDRRRHTTRERSRVKRSSSSSSSIRLLRYSRSENLSSFKHPRRPLSQTLSGQVGSGPSPLPLSSLRRSSLYVYNRLSVDGREEGKESRRERKGEREDRRDEVKRGKKVSRYRRMHYGSWYVIIVGVRRMGLLT